MTIGAARVTLYLGDTFSLKEKRGIVKSLIARARNQFNAAISEVEDLDDIRVATIGIVCVSNSADYLQGQLQAVVDFIERNVAEGVLGDVETELIPF
jgi:uncharacterized protein YlxP (DUF503 family)